MIDFDALAEHCNQDRRFLEAKILESAASLESLMATQMFQTTLRQLTPHDKHAVLETHIAAFYACRMAERKSKPKSVQATEAT